MAGWLAKYPPLTRIQTGLVVMIASFALVYFVAQGAVQGQKPPFDIRAVWQQMEATSRAPIILGFMGSAWGLGVVIDGVLALFAAKKKGS